MESITNYELRITKYEIKKILRKYNLLGVMLINEKKTMKTNNIVLEKAYQFALRIIKLYQYLVKKKKEYILSQQILKAGTSIVANLEEAMGGMSRKDFLAKVSIAWVYSKNNQIKRSMTIIRNS